LTDEDRSRIQRSQIAVIGRDEVALKDIIISMICAASTSP